VNSILKNNFDLTFTFKRKVNSFCVLDDGNGQFDAFYSLGQPGSKLVLKK
jgi:hypothetical protein